MSAQLYAGGKWGDLSPLAAVKALNRGEGIAVMAAKDARIFSITPVPGGFSIRDSAVADAVEKRCPTTAINTALRLSRAGVAL